jgi:hypothetical protein
VYSIMVQFPSFAWYLVFPTLLIEDTILSQCVFLLLLLKTYWRYMHEYFWVLYSKRIFCSIGLWVCFYASTILFCLLQFYNIVWNKKVWHLQLCCSWSRLFWLIRVLCSFIWILEDLSISVKHGIRILIEITLNVKPTLAVSVSGNNLDIMNTGYLAMWMPFHSFEIACCESTKTQITFESCNFFDFTW